MTRSATRLDVSTLPAATAAGKRAFSTQPSGAWTSIGRWAPAEGGASGSVSTRTAKNAADFVTASGQLRLPSTWSALPEKSSRSESPSIVARTRSSTSRSGPKASSSSTSLASYVAVGELGEPGAGAALAVGEDLLHPLAQLVQAVPAGELEQAPLADQVRRALRAQVGEPLRRVPHAPGELGELRLADQGRRDHDALLLERARVGRHPRGGRAADVGVVGAAGGEPQQLVAPPSAPAKIGEISVMSGRWVPPR